MADRRALRDPQFQAFLVGHGLSSAGTRMQDAALLWHLYALTGSAWALGLLGVVRLVPILALVAWGGVVADAADRRVVMLRTQTVAGLVAACLAALAALGTVQAWHLFVVAGVGAALDAFDTPARKTLVPRLVDADALPEALSLVDLAKNCAKLVGPVLMGLVTAWGGVEWVYGLNAVSYVAVLLALSRIDPARTRVAASPTPAVHRGVVASFVDGLAWMRQTPVVLGLVWLDFLATFLASAETLLPMYAVDVLGMDAAGYGLLGSAGAAGALGAGLLLSAGPRPKAPGATALWATAAYGAATVSFGLSTSFAACFASLALVGAMDTVSTVLRNATTQLATPDALRGRMTATSMVFTKSGPRLGEAEAGAVAAMAGPAFSVVVGGLACVAAVAYVAWRFPEVRRYRLA